MSLEHAPRDAPRIAVGGDVWVDFVGLKEKVQKDKSDSSKGTDKQRSTDESSWYFLRGGALLVETFVKFAVDGCDLRGHGFGWPDKLKALIHSSSNVLASEELIVWAERLTPKELPRSLLSLERFAEDAKKPDEKNRIRVDRRLGFSGSKKLKFKVRSPSYRRGADASFVVLDDRRDEFRNRRQQWPKEIAGEAGPVVVHKLHSPLPGPGNTNPLWDRLSSAHVPNHIVIVSIGDLRRPDTPISRGLSSDAQKRAETSTEARPDTPISRGLSWERTALDVVWQLLNADKFAVLRDCQHLIVRFGINGALYWRSQAGGGSYEASLIYDPAGIEGSAEQLHEGQMVGYGSAFVAGVLKHLVDNHVRSPVGEEHVKHVEKGVEAGLIAGRRLLKRGFTVPSAGKPRYPGRELFAPANKDLHKCMEGHEYFACQPVRVLPGASEPDPGYWRLLDDLVSVDSVEKKKKFDEAAASVVKDSGHHSPTLLQDVPIAVFAKFRTCDRREIEQYRALYNLMREYTMTPRPSRPLNVAVFGPPGAGKSFGVQELASALKTSFGETSPGDWAGLLAPRPTEKLTFNLSQYKSADELAAAFHQVRDKVLRGSMPLVFFDEFDTALGGVKLGWLRYFLSPMQDAEFLDRGLPHAIGPAIFVFGGGTCNSYEEFAQPFMATESQERSEFKNAKGPDFLSRLRAAVDIPGLDLAQPFDSYGSVELFPCEVAIQLRRASILKLRLREKEGRLPTLGGSLRVSDSVISALLKLREFRHGVRSFEALLDMSPLRDPKGSEDERKEFSPSSLPAPGHTKLHASARELFQLLAERDHFSVNESKKIADAIKADPFMAALEGQDVYQMSVEDIPRILRLAGCEFRRKSQPRNDSPVLDIASTLSRCPEREHDRWVAEKRRNGYVCGKPETKGQLRHPLLVPWDYLPPSEQLVYRHPIFEIGNYLAEVYVVTRSVVLD